MVMTTDVVFHEVPVLETELDRQDVPYRIGEVPLRDIDVDKGRGAYNASRLTGRLVEDDLVAIGMAVENGMPIARLFLIEEKRRKRGMSGRYWIADGHHRDAALRRLIFTQTQIFGGHAKAIAYIVKAEHIKDQRSFDLLVGSCNVHHGRREPFGERLAKAVSHVKCGMTVKETSSSLQVPFEKLQRSVAIEEGRERIASVGVHPDSPIAACAVEALDKIKDDEVLRRAATVVVEHGLPVEKVNQMVREVLAAETETQQNEIMREYAKERDDVTSLSNGKTKKHRGHSIASRVQAKLVDIRRLITGGKKKFTDIGDFGVKGAERKKLRYEVETTARVLLNLVNKRVEE
jgi:predicted subunit of tRNA(5-methylaminomethyl-2-thiouridylate) methyltransferase